MQRTLGRVADENLRGYQRGFKAFHGVFLGFQSELRVISRNSKVVYWNLMDILGEFQGSFGNFQGKLWSFLQV